jgi:predicted Zn-dependent protease
MIFSGSAIAAESNPVQKAMTQELDRSFTTLKKVSDTPLYFLQYTITDVGQADLSASLGALSEDQTNHNRYLDVDVRVGSPALDNTHEIREESGGFSLSMFGIPFPVSLDNDIDALRALLWSETDRAFKTAQERFIKVKTNKAVKVAEQDTSGDFSSVKPVTFTGETVGIASDIQPWRDRIKNLSYILKQYPWIHSSSVSFAARAKNSYIVNSEGTQIVQGVTHYRVSVYVSTTADDGMELSLYLPFDSRDLAGLPDDETIKKGIDSTVHNLESLRKAPLVEPYTGPAIMVNKAAGVFFHEIFGHRIEGHRQKSESEGQTFTKKVGEKVLPDFISIYDDPTIKNLEGIDLNGFYQYDNEGVPAERVTVVENGVLKNFLMSRSPVAGFARSNGHGRRQYGYKVVTRQGNLIVESKNQEPFARLRTMLIDECKHQGKPYGLVFYDISGGFTMTERYSPQAFKVVPLFVVRVHADGRPDEVVRGVDIVGTPLTSFSKIIATGDDPAVFNGTCGAESGPVAVSAISPSILVSEIEVEKKEKGQTRPPLLPPPPAQHISNDHGR